MMPSPRWSARVFGAVAAVAAAAAGGPAPAQGNRSLTSVDMAKEPARFAKLFPPYFTYPAKGRTATVGPDGVTLVLDRVTFDGPIGLKSEQPVSGDFQFEGKYELVKFPDTLSKGYGAGVGLWASAGAPHGEVKATRSLAPGEPGHHLFAGRVVPLADGKTHYGTARAPLPLPNKSGRLGLRRTGDEIAMLFAPTPDGELEEYYRETYTADPVKFLAIYAVTGGAEVDYKVRVYDLKVLTGPDAPTDRPKQRAVRAVMMNPVPKTAAVPVAPPRPPTASAPAEEPPLDAGTPTAAPVRGAVWLPVVTFLAGAVLGVWGGRRLRRTDAAPG